MTSETQTPGPISKRWLFALAMFAIATAVPTRAVDISGSLLVWSGAFRGDGVRNDEEDQTFRLALSQALTPWLTLSGSYRARSFRTSLDGQPAFERTTEHPEIGLSYDRDKFDARLSFSDRAIRTSDESQNLNLQTLLASLDWRPSRGPRFGLRFQDSTSMADPSLFGRDAETQTLDLRITHSRPVWSARYHYGLTKIANNATGLDLEQSRHEIRTDYSRSLWQDRWSLTLDGRFADVEQMQEAPAGAAVGLPVSVAQGLFAIDATPSLGALEPASGLIDGDTTTPVSAGIEIGGANTFRNIGVDLGVTRTISELEISVDAASGPVIWEVWESPDNSSWFQVGNVVSSFDAGFLRHTIRFPETTNRYLKAVNVSVNAVLDVAVTEIRALFTTTQLERSEGDSNEYWLNLQTSLRPVERIEIAVAANLRSDRNLVATALRRSMDERGISALLRWELIGHLWLRLGHRISQLEETLRRPTERREEESSAALEWRPLDTVNVLMTAQRRDETESDQILSKTDSLTLRATTDFFPGLRLNSTFGIADTLDTSFGFTQETRYWIGDVEARPNDRWLLSGGVSRHEYDSLGRVTLRRRTAARLRASWFATPFLSLHGEWLEGTDDLGKTRTRRYGLQWTPGPKLALSTSYFDTTSSVGTGTANLTLDGSYRLNRRIRLWLAANEAETMLSTPQPSRTESVRFGLSVIF